MRFSLVLLALLVSSPVVAKPLIVEPKLHHLRSGSSREWSDFPAEGEGPSLTMKFSARTNAAEQTLRLRQQDVKQAWQVLLNGKVLGRLVPDENDQELVLGVPAGRLIDGENMLVIESGSRIPDDIRVGEVEIDDRPVAEMLNEAAVELTVREGGTPLPCRITVLNVRGMLAATGARSTDRMAVRPGVLYTADGAARFGLPAGEYTIHAGRGFEYGIDVVRVSLKPGETVRKELSLRREVPTAGWIACDAHVHSLTHSGHGDATDIERAITLAGECIELPIATDHNVQVDYAAAAAKAGVRKYFTPVVGNEVTTDVGHFNVFPLPAGGRPPDYRVKDWMGVAASLGAPTGPRAAILNHPRDLHGKFRPFGPERFLSATGEFLDGWDLPANAMEVVNSGALQSDVMLPVRDWFALLNRGVMLTPVGASDSHDVSRYIVGQARTYIRCPDDNPGKIDVPLAVKSFTEGRVLVSCGLLADITVEEKYGPGDLAPAGKEVAVSVRVLGPSWARADRIELYANGILVQSKAIEDRGAGGLKWNGKWMLPRPRHDMHLVAVASGPGVEDLFWPIAKPYQPSSPAVRKRILGVSGAVWIDSDGDGRRTSAFETARRLLAPTKGDWKKSIAALAEGDEAVAAQAAGLLRAEGVAISSPEARAAAKAAGPHVERGFDAYAEAWRECRLAKP